MRMPAAIFADIDAVRSCSTDSGISKLNLDAGCGPSPACAQRCSCISRWALKRGGGTPLLSSDVCMMLCSRSSRSNF
jgi:hypothetical protein